MAQGGYRFLFDVDEHQSDRVFHDPTYIRRRKFRRFMLAGFFGLITWAFLFLDGTLSFQRVAEELRFWWHADRLPKQESSLAPNQPEHAHGENLVSATNFRSGGEDICADRAAPAFSALADQAGERLFGHVPTELEWAPLSLQSSCGALDVIVPEWVFIKTSGQQLFVDVVDASTREPVEAYVGATDQPPLIMPTVSLEMGYDPEGFLEMLVAPKTASSVVASLVAASKAHEATGLCLDFKQLDQAQLTALAPVFDQVKAGLSAAGLQSCVVLSVEQGIWANQELMRDFDNVILTAFRQPWVGSAPGPLASDAWFEDLAKQALDAIGPERLTLALGNFSVEWTPRQPLPEKLPFAEAIQRLAKADATVNFSQEPGNSFSSYRDAAGNIRKVWFLDAASAHNQIITLRALGVRNVGIWSLGLEDPGLWKVVSNKDYDQFTLAGELSKLTFSNYVSYEGEGPFLRVRSGPNPGLRFVKFDNVSGRITGLSYARLPKPYMMERYGRPAPEKLVLTFDDGPHSEYTTSILDALKETQTPAAFFVVGTSVMEEPDLLQRIFDEGHEVGSHTFSHPRMDQISRSRTDLEHGMMTKLIAGYAGYSTRLYREPFLRANGPIEESRVRSLMTVQANGGIIAGMEIVPKDWEGLSSGEIVDYVLEQVDAGAGNVILLHDGGKDRSATVEAVPILIRELTEKGYEFTTLADLLGMETAALMPPVTGHRLVFDRVSFGFLSTAWFSLEVVFWTVLCIGILRMLMIFGLALFRKRARPVDDSFTPKVTVVIPAYNEENVVAKCIRSVLASNYDNFDVLVIDDGSTDETFNELLKFRNNPQVQIFAQLNRGKWSALNAAVANIDAEIMVCIDADTEIHPDAIGHLARQFCNPRIGAVAGKIAVGNRNKLLTRLQALEYVTAQNFDRRGFDMVNGLLVVPGAIGAWRVAAVREVGVFCNDTITEDADLTISLNRAGYRVTYEDKAVAYTEAPESVRQLLAQRLRWSLGMFQCAWKHKGAFREGRAVGLVSIPDMFIFGYLFPLLAPIADLFILILLYNTFSGTWDGQIGEAVSNTPSHLIWAYLTLPLLDLAIAAFALKTDRNENMRMLLLFPFQRFFYRQLLYFSVYRSLLRAVSGTFAGWGRMKRVGRQYFHQRTAQ